MRESLQRGTTDYRSIRDRNANVGESTAWLTSIRPLFLEVDGSRGIIKMRGCVTDSICGVAVQSTCTCYGAAKIPVDDLVGSGSALN